MQCRQSQVFLTDEFLVLVMEYAAGGDLFRRVSTAGGLPEAEACWYFAQIVMALDYCHQMVGALGCCSLLHRGRGQPVGHWGWGIALGVRQEGEAYMGRSAGALLIYIGGSLQQGQAERRFVVGSVPGPRGSLKAVVDPPNTHLPVRFWTCTLPSTLF